MHGGFEILHSDEFQLVVILTAANQKMGLYNPPGCCHFVLKSIPFTAGLQFAAAAVLHAEIHWLE